MSWATVEYTEKLVRYFRGVCERHPEDEAFARDLRFAEELARLNRERPSDWGSLLRSLIRRLEEARSSGDPWGSGVHEVYVAAKNLAETAP
ncbi:hypothetical protein F0U60_03310 [Archangium minus]|uniref:CdiI immunity protein domain-containing protein n=1 Tax=Archangium minus TaxID=83450 RepID=A0ABY9WHF5_9BACT|nr:hypothetical protein F0U60_03310 [Archangium minus]